MPGRGVAERYHRAEKDLKGGGGAVKSETRRAESGNEGAVAAGKVHGAGEGDAAGVWYFTRGDAEPVGGFRDARGKKRARGHDRFGRVRDVLGRVQAVPGPRH